MYSTTKPHLFNAIRTFTGDQVTSIANGQPCVFLCKPYMGDDAMWFESTTVCDALEQADREFGEPSKVMMSAVASEYNAYFAN
jgi:hypothetical protein